MGRLGLVIVVVVALVIMIAIIIIATHELDRGAVMIIPSLVGLHQSSWQGNLGHGNRGFVAILNDRRGMVIFLEQVVLHVQYRIVIIVVAVMVVGLSDQGKVFGLNDVIRLFVGIKVADIGRYGEW